jgi:hypothetical protein
MEFCLNLLILIISLHVVHHYNKITQKIIVKGYAPFQKILNHSLESGHFFSTQMPLGLFHSVMQD